MSIIESLKNCEGCRKRRRFIKQMLSGIGLTFLWPLRVKADPCEGFICPNGTTIILCCDTVGCSTCQHWTAGGCVWVNEYCNGEWTTYAICCRNNTGFSQADSHQDESMIRWIITFEEGVETLLSASKNIKDDFDPIAFFNKRATVKTHGHSVQAISSRKM